MKDNTRICKICGKEYEYCHTARKGNVFRWQDVACCEEHGREYFARIEAKRSGKYNKETTQTSKPKQEEVTTQTSIKDESAKSAQKEEESEFVETEDFETVSFEVPESVFEEESFEQAQNEKVENEGCILNVADASKYCMVVDDDFYDDEDEDFDEDDDDYDDDDDDDEYYEADEFDNDFSGGF